MTYTESEKYTLEKVNEIGLQIGVVPEIENIIFIVLSPHLNNLMTFLKQLEPHEMDLVFMQYKGVMKVMRMIENEAQNLEKSMLA